MATIRQSLSQLSLQASRIDDWVRLRSPRLRALLPHWALSACVLTSLVCGCVAWLTPLYAAGHANGSRVLVIQLLAGVLAISWIALQWRTRVFLPRQLPSGAAWSPLSSILVLLLALVPPLTYEGCSYLATPDLQGGSQSQAYQAYEDLNHIVEVLEDNQYRLKHNELLARTMRDRCTSWYDAADRYEVPHGDPSDAAGEPDRSRFAIEQRRLYCAAPEQQDASPFCRQLRQLLCRPETAEGYSSERAMLLLHLSTAQTSDASVDMTKAADVLSWAVKPMRSFDSEDPSSAGATSALTSSRVVQTLLCKPHLLPKASDRQRYRQHFDPNMELDISRERLDALMSRHLSTSEIHSLKNACQAELSTPEQDKAILRMRQSIKEAGMYAVNGSHSLKPNTLLIHIWLLLLGASIVSCAGTLPLSSLLKAAAIHIVVIVLGGPLEDTLAPAAEGATKMADYLSYVVAPRAVVAAGLLLWVWRKRSRSAHTDVMLAWLVLLGVAFNANALLENVAHYGSAGLLLEHMHEGWQLVFVMCTAAGLVWLVIMHALVSRYRRRPLSQ